MTTVLVVDDDPDLEALLGGAAGPDVRFVRAAGPAATDALDAGVADVALVGVGGNGADARFRRLREAAPLLPVIALASAGDMAAIRRAMNAGAVDFLTTPIDAADFTVTLEKVARGGKERRRACRAEDRLRATREELGVAARIQQGILPRRFRERDDMEIFAQMTPAREMGGDFYDFFEIGEGRLGLVVADVAGKGVPAAFFMAAARTMIRATALTGARPGACLATVNTLICRDDVPGMLVSVFYGVLDTKAWELTFANGGHQPPYMIQGEGGVVTEVAGGAGVVLGVEEGLSYAEDSVPLYSGDSLFCYTDGLTEAFDVERRQFGDARLIQALTEGIGLSAEAAAVNVFAAVDSFTFGAPQNDDITCLMLRRACG